MNAALEFRSRVLSVFFVGVSTLIWGALTQAQPETAGLEDVHSGVLLLKTDQPGRYVPVISQKTDARIRVTGVVARGVVEQTFTNPGNNWAEAIYAFPLPEDAAVHRMRVKIGERIVEGHIKEKQAARQIYEAAKQEGKQTALVEQHRPNLFSTNVANIPPNGDVKVEIEYQQTVVWRDAQFSLRFPMTITPRYSPGSAGTVCEQTDLNGGGWAILPGELPNVANIEPPTNGSGQLNSTHLTLTLDSGFPLATLESRYHAIDKQEEKGVYQISLKSAVSADRDFELVWTPQPDKNPHAAFFTEHIEAGDYGLLMLMPAMNSFEQQARRDREITFIIDTSGSMGGESLNEAKTALLMALKRLRSDDQFNVIEFNSVTRPLFDKPVSADAGNLVRAMQFVQQLVADGGTEMLGALEKAFEYAPTEGLLAQVVFITDGAVGNEQGLFQIIHQQLGNRRLFTVGIGSAPNAHFMTEAAHVGRGTYTYISDVTEVQEKIETLFRKVERPALTDIALKLPVTADALPDPIPDLYVGEPISVVMKLDNMPAGASLEGNLGNLRWTHDLALHKSTAQNGLGVMWARSKIQFWSRKQVEGKLSETEVQEKILELALQHHLVSRYTSLVAVDVTPVRPSYEKPGGQALKNQIPAGWNAPDAQQSTPEDAVVAMAHGATPSLQLLLLGLLLLASGSLLLWNNKAKRENA